MAVASGPVRAAIAVVRLSGPDAIGAVERLAGGGIQPRRATLRAIRDGRTGERIDEGLLLTFPGPRSATGENCAELHVHGGPAVVRKVLETVLDDPRVRLARAGEFTLRALESGRLDLSQVEALGDLIAADTEVQRKAAMRAFEGTFGEVVAGWRRQLLKIATLLEADIDFNDEGDVSVSASEVKRRVDTLAAELATALAGSVRQERVQTGLRVVLAGLPNAGKSSLLNALSGRDAAIVSPIPGTTRDVLEVRLEFAGVPVTVCDVAGLRESEDELERIGIERARRAIADADLVFWLSETDQILCPFPDAVLVRSKLDLDRRGVRAEDIGLSIRTGEGLDRIISLMEERAAAFASSVETSWTLNQRQHLRLQDAERALRGAGAHIGDAPELTAAAVRQAANALQEVVGAIGVEHVLDEVFSRFCIGK